MRLRCLSGADIAEVLPMDQAIKATRRAYVALSEGRVIAPQRQALPVGADGALNLIMSGYVPEEGLATKIVAVFPGNAALRRPVITGLVVVQDEETGAPCAILDGTFLTAWRTGAAAGLATDLLARPRAKRAALVGCGAQAPAQLLALDAVRELEIVRLFNRTRARAEDLVRRMSGRVRAELVVAETVGEAVAKAEVVTLATSASEPAFEGSLLASGAHVNAMGSFTLEMRELDAVAVGRSRVFVDSVQAALLEAGELVAAENAGATRREDWIEIGRVASGAIEGRRSEDEITLFKSVGQAAQDVVAAAAVVRAAEVAGRGVLLDL